MLHRKIPLVGSLTLGLVGCGGAQQAAAPEPAPAPPGEPTESPAPPAPETPEEPSGLSAAQQSENPAPLVPFDPASPEELRRRVADACRQLAACSGYAYDNLCAQDVWEMLNSYAELGPECMEAYLSYYECAIDVTCTGSDDYAPCYGLYEEFYYICSGGLEP